MRGGALGHVFPFVIVVVVMSFADSFVLVLLLVLYVLFVMFDVCYGLFRVVMCVWRLSWLCLGVCECCLFCPVLLCPRWLC